MPQQDKKERVVIIGAGPAGLTAALELLRQGKVEVVLLEASGDCGGLSKTVNYKGNRIDIGGHRFFSKSDWVMEWWQDILPMQAADEDDTVEIAYRNKRRPLTVHPNPAPAALPGAFLMLRNRLSRIYFQGKFFAYPVKANVDTLWKLGLPRVCRILSSYALARLFPRRPQTSLEDFLINRFGRELYRTFFQEYTEKVWGKPCTEISAEWGAQRIKGLSILAAMRTALQRLLAKGKTDDKAVATSLIERFLYPAHGPGQMWETVADRVRDYGGSIRFHTRAEILGRTNRAISSVRTRNTKTGEIEDIEADYVISTMPVADLIASMQPFPPQDVRRVAAGLEYRDFITVGLLLRRLRKRRATSDGAATHLIPDNWIYVQDRGVNVGRLQIFNNWSPYMVADPDTVWIGLEYFCRQGDDLWSRADSALIELAARELEQIDLADRADVLDAVVIRMPKAYPAYYGTYQEFDRIRQFTDQISNLFLIGRNGMHRYNNQDHSMLTARFAAQAILSGKPDKSAIWNVNIDDDYHEEKQPVSHGRPEDRYEATTVPAYSTSGRL
jgi:protoporphyrinogen oxidase